VHEDIVGVVTASGGVPAQQDLCSAQKKIQYRIREYSPKLDADGIKAVNSAESHLGRHQAIWFAWLQFPPETALSPQ
jgi:hypothetical protein